MARDEKDRRRTRAPPSGAAGRPVAARGAAAGADCRRRATSIAGISTRRTSRPSSTRSSSSSARRFEGAEAKQAVPGASALLRELRAGGGARICFISGSPRQMRRVLTKKLKLDGVEFDEFILKPNLRNMLTGRFRAMREQVGYKLPALLAGRAGLPPETRETCFGDDAEADGFIYSLYGDIIAGRVNRRPARGDPRARRHLRRRRAARGHARRGAAAARGGVAHLHPPRSPLADLALRSLRRAPRAGVQLLPGGDGDVRGRASSSAPAVVRVALEMVDRYGYTIDALRNSLQDLLRRGRLLRATARHARRRAHRRARCPQLGALPSGARAAHLVRRAGAPARRRAARCPIPLETPIDYLAALEADLPRKGKKRTDIAPPVT